MIQLVTDKNCHLFQQAAELEPVPGAKAQTLYQMSGAEKYADFWVQINSLNAPTAALYRYGGQMGVISGMDANQEELLEFVRFQITGCSELIGSPMLCGQLQDLGKSQSFYVMTRQGSLFEDDYSAITKAPPLTAIFDLLCDVDSRFEDNTSRPHWHVHTSHLLRHKLGYNAGIIHNGKLISTGGIYNIGASHAVISELATLEDYRGQGYGGLICRYLSDLAIKQKKRPSLYAATERMKTYYESMNFKTTTRWTSLKPDTGRQLEAGHKPRPSLLL